MRVTMTETRAGSPDGIRSQLFEAGRTYDLRDSLAESFLAAGWAKAEGVQPAKVEPAPAKTHNNPTAAQAASVADAYDKAGNPKPPAAAPTPPVVAPVESKTDDDTLPADFPAREALVAAGLETLAAVAALSKDDLIALPKIGKAAAGRILAALEG